MDGGVCEKAWIKSALPLFSSYFLHLSFFLFRTTWMKKGALVGNLGELNGFLVSKETMVLRRWGRSKQKFGFIKRVEKC